MNCQDEINLINEPAFQALTLGCVISSLLSYVFMGLFLKRYARKLFWHSNVKVLFFSGMGASAWLAFTVIFNFVSLWIRMKIHGRTCDSIIQLKDCYILRCSFLCSFCLISLNHCAIFFERLYATVNVANYEKERPYIGVGLKCASIAIAIIITWVIMLPEDSTELVPSCLSFSATKIGNGLYWLFTCQCGMEIVLAFFQRLLLRYNRKRCEKVKHLDDNLSEKFQMNENLAVLEQMSPLVITCSLVIGFYQIVALILRSYRADFTKNHYIIFAFAIFIIPHLPFLLNLIALYTHHQQLKKRNKMAKAAVQIDREKNANFTNNFDEWDRVYEKKYAQKPIEEPKTHIWTTKSFNNKVDSVH